MTIRLKHIIYTFLLMVIGILIFKTLPMYLYGKDILFDASRHVIATSFGLYFLYYLFLQNREELKIPFFIFSSMILGVIAIQRIIAGEHNEYGILLGFFVAGISILVPIWNKLGRGLK